MAKFDAQFDQVAELLERLRGRLPSPLDGDLISRRLLRAQESISDLKVAWHRYETDLDDLLMIQQHLQGVVTQDTVTGPLSLSLGQASAWAEFRRLTPLLAFDIRCIYIFSNITFDCLTTFITTISRRLYCDFEEVFAEDVIRFRSHIELYRNKFVAHPTSPVALSGIAWGVSGARIGGSKFLLDADDRAWLESAASRLGHQFHHEGDRYSMHRYEWLCQNLHRLTEEQRKQGGKLVERIGLDSGDVEGNTGRPLSILPKMATYCDQRMQTFVRIPA